MFSAFIHFFLANSLPQNEVKNDNLNFIHYYPYLVKFKYLSSFTYHDGKQISHNKISIFSIKKTRGRCKMRRNTLVYEATFNLYTHNYEFDDLRFISYEDMISYILNSF